MSCRATRTHLKKLSIFSFDRVEIKQLKKLVYKLVISDMASTACTCIVHSNYEVALEAADELMLEDYCIRKDT